MISICFFKCTLGHYDIIVGRGYTYNNYFQPERAVKGSFGVWLLLGRLEGTAHIDTPVSGSQTC